MKTMKKVFNAEAIADRLSLITLMHPEFELLIKTKSNAMVYAELRKKDDPNWCLGIYGKEYLYDGKVQVRLEYPDEQKTYKDKSYYKSINMSIEKDASAMWADIQKRLLPEYEQKLAEVVAAEEKTRLFRENQNNLRKELVEKGYCQDFYNERESSYLNDEYRLGHSGSLTVSGGTIELNLGYIPKDKAMQILDFIKGLK